jgi:hypothetical protein
MPYALYVCLQDDDKIATFALDAETGRLTPGVSRDWGYHAALADRSFWLAYG